MTLTDFFRFASEHHAEVLIYFTLIPFAALLAGFMEREEGQLPPWNFLYSTLLYLVAVPAILSVALTVYRWLFERGSILEADLLLQFLPVASFLITWLIVRDQVSVRALPGFGRLSGLVGMIVAALVVMWVVDRIHFVVFSRMKMQYLVLAFLLLLYVIRKGWRRLTTA